MYNQWFAAYQRLGGAKDYDSFCKSVQTFFDLTQDAYISGIGSRRQAWNKWVTACGDRAEARLVFDAVDAVTAYT
jgi:hypothetical protein